MPGRQKTIAAIGSGISGLAAAYLLSRRHRVHLFEKEPRLGGHTNTVVVEGANGAVALDTGFLVHNDRTYPNLVRLFGELGVATRDSDMSFAVSCRRSGLEVQQPQRQRIVAQRGTVRTLSLCAVRQPPPETDAVSQSFGSIKATLERRGTRIEDVDAAIAAHALALDATLVTANVDHMIRVQGYSSRTGGSRRESFPMHGWIHGDSDVFRLLDSARGSAQYVRMRSEIALRFFGVSSCRPAPLFLAGAVFVDFAGRVCPICSDDAARVAAVDGFSPACGPLAGVAGAISMPNISDRSSLARTLVPAGRLFFVEKSDPAVAIKSC